MWLTFALLSALLWTGVSLYDRFSVKAIFTRPAQGLFVAALFSGFGFLALPFVKWSIPETEIAGMAVLAGLLMQFAQYSYFHALQDEEVGKVTAFGAAYPVAVGLASIPLGKLLTVWQWSGVLLVVGSVVAIEGVKVSREVRRSVAYLAGYVGGLSGGALLLSGILEVVNFWSAFGPYCLGLIFGGLVPFVLSRTEREELRRAWPSIWRALWKLGLVEGVNVAALGCEAYALSLGHPALVTAAASTEPAWVFLAGNFLSRLPFPPGVFERVERVHRKILLVALIISGLGLLAWE